MSDECRYPKCDVCGADARADATPRRWVFAPSEYDGVEGIFVEACAYDSKVKAHEMTANELKCAEAELATLTDWTNKRGHWYTAELDRIKAERDSLAAQLAQVCEAIDEGRQNDVNGGFYIDRNHAAAIAAARKVEGE